MKRAFTLFFLFVVAIGAWADGAKVAMLTGFGTNTNVDAAKTWFDAANNADRDELSITTTPFTTFDAATLAATYSVIWVYWDGLSAVGDYPGDFTDAHMEKLRDYVKAGGNLLLTGQASKLAWKIGRAPQPNVYSENNPTSTTSDIWGVTTKIWRDDNNKVYDHSSHPLFSSVDLENGYFYRMTNASTRNDNNCMWSGDASFVPSFEIKYNCSVLGTWQQESNNYANAGIVEFQPTGEYKGRILAIGVAAYQWTSSDYLDNVKTMTTNGLNYLKNRYDTSGQTKVAYLLPVNLSRNDNYTTTDYQTAALGAVDQDDERTALQWFIDEIVSKGKGAIIEPKDLADLDPNIITTVWVNIDRDGDNAYPSTGWSVLWQENMKQLLKRYVSNAGRLLLTKHAVQLVQPSGGMNRCNIDPWVTTGKAAEGTIGIKDNEDPWAINAVIGAGYVNAKSSYVSYDYTQTREKTDNQTEQGYYYHITSFSLVGDHRTDPLYFNVRTVQGEYPITDEVDIITKEGEDQDKYEVFYLVGRGVKEDHNCLWDGINAGTFETNNNCVILGQWGHLSKNTNAAIVKFNSNQEKGAVGDDKDRWEGEILTIGLAAYEWQPSNNDGTAREGENPYLNDIKQLTYNALNLLDAPEIVETQFDYTYGGVTYELHTRGVLHYAKIKSADENLEVYDLTQVNGQINKGQINFPGDSEDHEAATYNITNIENGAFTSCQSLAYADLMAFQGVVPTNIRECFPAWTIIYVPREEVTTLDNCELVGENIVNTIFNTEKTADIKVSEKLKLYDNVAGDTYVYHLFANKYEFTANAVEFSRSFTANVNSTICLPFAVSADETSGFGQFYAFDKVNGDDVRFAAVSSTEAYKPYMFEPSTNGTVISINAAKTIGTLDATPTFAENKYTLTTTLPQNWYDDAAGKGANFIGEFRPVIFAGAKSLGIYSYKSDGTFKTTTGTIYADPFRAYLKLNTPPSTAKVFRAVFEDFTPTGIFNANADEETNDGAYYTLQGIKVSNPGPGIYIHNKKKIIIKK